MSNSILEPKQGIYYPLFTVIHVIKHVSDATHTQTFKSKKQNPSKPYPATSHQYC